MSKIFSLLNIKTEIKHSAILILPLIATEIFYGINGFVSNVMVAHLGVYQLAANALVWNIYLAIILFFIGILSVVSIMTAQSYGANDAHGIAQNFKQGLILAILFSLPITFFVWHMAAMLKFFGQDSKVIFYAVPLFHSYALCMFPLAILFTVEQFLLGIGKTRMVLFMSIITVPIQIFFCYGFLFGKFYLPNLGIIGAGYSCLIAFIIGDIYLFFYLRNVKSVKIYNLFHKWWHVNRKFILEMLRVGLPLGFMWCTEVSLFAVIAFLVGHLGAQTLTAYQVSYQYFVFAIPVLFAITQATMVRVGFEVGQNNKDNLKRAVVVNVAIGLLFMVIISVVYSIFKTELISVDFDMHNKNNLPVINLAQQLFSIVCIALLVESFRIIIFGALRGIKDTRFSFLASVCGFWCIAFPLIYLSVFKFHFGAVGVWWSLLSGLAATGIIAIARFCVKIKDMNLTAIVTK